ncbi:SDR family NAD(P)-dependent oxidoreductase [Chloroflexota bacterium]
MLLGGKVAIVTGGGKGIGEAISLAFANEGADVVVAARSESAIKEVASKIEVIGRKSLAVVTDLSSPEQILAMVDKTLGVFGRVDVLVNNSGIEGPTVNVENMDLDAWNEVLAVNLTGSMLCTRQVLKKSMIPSRNGVIVNISSIAGRVGFGWRSPYSTSKWGIISLTQTLAWEVGRYSIRVNCIAPGAVEGDRLERVLRERSKVRGIPFEKVLERESSRSALRRMVKPEEVAALAVFLASEQSSGITGQTINCCAGLEMS